MKIKKLYFIVLIFVVSFLIGIIPINTVKSNSNVITMDYKFEKNSLFPSYNDLDKKYMNLRHNNIITQNYNASYSFENEVNFTSTNISFIDSNSLDTCIILSNSDYHNEILHLQDSIDFQKFNHTFDNSQEFGTIEFWINLVETTTVHRIILYSDTTIFTYLMWDNTLKLQYHDGNWHDIVSYTNNIWYHIRIDFECGNNLYEGLSEDKMFIYVNDIKYGEYSTTNDVNSLNGFIYDSKDSANTYFDAIGFSWLDNYTIGLNKYPNIEIVDSNILSNDKYEFNLNDNGNPYATYGFPDVDYWNRVGQYGFDVVIDTPDFYAKSKNINGVVISSSQDGSATGIRNESLGINRDKINITFGLQITNMNELNSYSLFKISSLNNSEIIKLKFDTQTNTKTNLQYYDGSSYQNLVSIYGINSTNVYNFNLYIENYQVKLLWYKNDVYNNTYSFPLIINSLGINQIYFYNYDPTSNTDYYILRLNYIGIYQYNISLCRELGLLIYNLLNNWDFQKCNILNLISSETLKIVSYSISAIPNYYIIREYDNKDFRTNLYEVDKVFNNPYLYLIIQSNINISGYIFFSIDGIKLNKYINNIFNKEISIQYYFHNVDVNKTFYYIDNSNRLSYQFDITQNDTLEYMMLYFDFISGISSNNMTIYFKCRELSIKVGKPYIAMTYYQPPDDYFYLKTYPTTIHKLLIRDKEFNRFYFVITDDNNNYYTNRTGNGYIYGLQYNYYPLGVSDISFLTISLLAIMIPLIIIICPTIGIYYFYRKKEIIIPILLLMSIICYVCLLIPFELFFIMLLCYGCGIFIQYKKRDIE